MAHYSSRLPIIIMVVIMVAFTLVIVSLTVFLINKSLGSTTNTREFLKVNGTDFIYGKNKVFLSGVNIAWYRYGNDFGNNQYETTGPVLEKWVREISAAGGNSLRIWIHCEGGNTPQFNSDGYPTATDAKGTLISDLSKFLEMAAANNVFVVIVLWNGAIKIDGKYGALFTDDKKLDAYFKTVLEPMVQGLKNKRALAAWEIMNEPEGSVLVSSDTDSCYDTTRLKNYGANWTKSNVTMKNILKFINKLSAVIKRVDPKALVTLGSWSERAQTDAFADTYNYYKDSCLTKAGGEAKGTIDFYQTHTYAWKGAWGTYSPFKVSASSFKLDKPLVIGEFSSACSAKDGVDTLWDHAYHKGYKGVWSWQYNAGGDCADTTAAQVQGMRRIRNYTTNGHIAIKIY